MSDELKPCPFCGGEAELRNDTNKPKVFCDWCGTGFYFGVFGDGVSKENREESVLETWNTRHQPTENRTEKE